MGKITNELAELMKTAMKNKEKEKLTVLRNIKAKFLEFKTSKLPGEGPAVLVNGEMTDEQEILSIKRMVKELNKAIPTYGDRQDLIDEVTTQINILEEFLPKAASEADIKAAVEKWIEENGKPEQKQMGNIMKYVKANLENADGAMVASIVKTYIN